MRLVLVGSLAAGAIAAIAAMLKFIAWSDASIWLGAALAIGLLAHFGSWGSLELSSNGKTVCYVSDASSAFTLGPPSSTLQSASHSHLTPNS
jgi:hypothetical protein